MVRRVRKQVHQLTASDFEMYSCWEYAEDEEGREDQDECTVRPLALQGLTEVTHQVFVQAAFLFPNGRIRNGIVTLNAGNDVSGHQPVLFLPDGELLMFYEGSSEPRPSTVRGFLAKLKKISPIPLPVRYVSALHSPAGEPLASGILQGVYWLANWPTGQLSVVA